MEAARDHHQFVEGQWKTIAAEEPLGDERRQSIALVLPETVVCLELESWLQKILHLRCAHAVFFEKVCCVAKEVLESDRVCPGLGSCPLCRHVDCSKLAVFLSGKPLQLVSGQHVHLHEYPHVRSGFAPVLLRQSQILC